MRLSIVKAAYDEAGKGNDASNMYAFQSSSLASDLEENKEEVLSMLNNEALRGV